MNYLFVRKMSIQVIQNNQKNRKNKKENVFISFEFLFDSLIRLRVDYTGFDLFDSFNDIRFVQKFSEQVANAKTMINLHKKREQNLLKSKEIKLDPNAIKISNEQFQQAQRVEDSIQAYFESTTEVNKKKQEYFSLSDNLFVFFNRQIVYVYLMKNQC